jgi:hypothetical protein
LTEAVSRPRKPARIVAVLGVVCTALALLVGAHWYLARRLVLDPGLPEPLRSAALALLAVAFVAFLAGPIAERTRASRWRRPLVFASYTWWGVLWIALAALASTEGVFFLLGAAGESSAAAGWRAALAGGAIVLAAAQALREGTRLPAVRRVEIVLPRWPRALDGLRIAQISDIHIGPLLRREFAAEVTRRVNALDADLVAVTGDLVDGPVDRLHEEVEPFAELRGRHGVFFVTGNHDVYSGDDAWVERVRGLGWRVLRNERVTIEHQGARFDLAGVDDHRGDWVSGSTEDLEAALADRGPDQPVVLLAHDPSTFKRAQHHGVDLQLSGHTHGGQIWPFRYVVRMAVPFVAGLYRRGASQLYVSRGTGFWGPPMRLFAPAEITELVLRSVAR